MGDDTSFRAENGLGAPIPRAPKGYQTCNVHDGRQDLWAKGARRQVNHLVAVPTSGPTLCGLTRFGTDADLPGWSMGGGVFGPTIVQAPCPVCWQAVEPPASAPTGTPTVTIADQLREHADRVAGGGPADTDYDPETLMLEHEAADELDRLTRLIERLQAAGDGMFEALAWDQSFPYDAVTTRAAVTQRRAVWQEARRG